MDTSDLSISKLEAMPTISAGVAKVDDAAAQARDLKTQPLRDTRSRWDVGE